MAVLSKAGCNAGACHGNASGKGGFKLSLRGEDPESDYLALTRDSLGRRVDPMDPDQSLVLLKPTTRLAHEGGLRFDLASPEYTFLRRWIAAGTPRDPEPSPSLESLRVTPLEMIVRQPDNSVALTAEAHFSDGTLRDVSRLAVYEPTRAGVRISANGRVEAETPGEVTILVRYLNQQVPVRLAFIPDRPDFAWPEIRPRNLVDVPVFAKLKALRLPMAEEVDDSRFLRRATLDLLGLLPTAEEARAFLADDSPDKRARCVDTLLQRPEFADFWALKWCDLLRNEEKALDRKGVELFHRWIRSAIASGMPFDEFVRALLTAQGSTYDHPAANFYRSLRSLNTRAETVAQVFLGTRLGCAQCHNHPYDRWTQSDYHEWSALFARVQYRVLENRYPDGLDKHGFTGEQIVFTAHEGEATNPKNGRTAAPRCLGSSQPLDPDANRLEALAHWLTSPDNPRFAPAQVNRIWYHLMGRGLVDPVDDFRATNPASHPDLLDTLTREFVEHHFDLRHVIRLIMNSRTYQTGSDPGPVSDADFAGDADLNYAHNLVRRLDAEPLLDALCQVTGVSLHFQGYPEGLRAAQIPGVQAVAVRRRAPGEGDRFLKVFGKPQRLLASEEERSCQTTLAQALQLTTGPVLHDLLSRPDNRIDRLLASGRSTDELITDLYWTALTRPPRAEELNGLSTRLDAATDRRAAFEDLTWALLNSKEFLFRH